MVSENADRAVRQTLDQLIDNARNDARAARIEVDKATDRLAILEASLRAGDAMPLVDGMLDTLLEKTTILDRMPVEQDFNTALASIVESTQHRLDALLMAKRILTACSLQDQDNAETRVRLAYALVAAGLSSKDLRGITGLGHSSVVALVLDLSDIAARAPIVGHAAHYKIIALEKRIHCLLTDMTAAGLMPTRDVVAGTRKLKLRGKRS